VFLLVLAHDVWKAIVPGSLGPVFSASVSVRWLLLANTILLGGYALDAIPRAISPARRSDRWRGRRCASRL